MRGSSWRNLLATALVCLTSARPAPAAADDPMSDDPEVERRLLLLPQGFEIQLYASEPEIINPVTMNFDAQGRLWVLCLPGYPHVLVGQESRDYIRVLDPIDEKTGKPKGSHVFASGLTVPTGMIPGDGGAYVGDADSLWHLKDTDGDGKADEKRLLLSGFGTQDTHHTLNTFRWGPDGRLYFNQGCYILSSVETPYGLRRMFGGAMWQLRPDSLNLEVFDRSIINNNTWGHVFDDWGRSLMSSAWPADINLVLPETPLNRSNDSSCVPALPMTKIAGDRHSGLERITGRHFPPEWAGNLVSGGFQSQRVNRFAVDEVEGKLVGKELEPLVASKHRKFRPVDMKIGPDGALYVADWYNLIIQHNQVDFRDPRRDHGHGRIWRITYKGRPLVERPDLTGDTIGVLEHLKDPEQWTRDQARRVLAGRDHDEVAKALGTWVTGLKDERHLLEALWVYQTIDRVEPALLKRLFDAKDEHVRAAAVTVLGYWWEHVDDWRALLEKCARDDKAQVRLAAVLAAQRIPSAEAFEAAMNASSQPMDDTLNFELRKLAIVLKPYWYPGFEAGTVTMGGDVRRVVSALLALRAPEAAPKLMELYTAGKVETARRAELLATVAGTGGAKELAGVLDAAAGESTLQPAEQARVLDGLADAARGRQVVPDGNLSPIGRLMAREDAVGLSAIRLAGAWRVETLKARLKDIAQETGSRTARREAAMGALLEMGEKDFVASLAKTAAVEVRVDAVSALAGSDLKTAAEAGAPLILQGTTDQVRPVFAALVKREGGGDALADAMKDSRPSADVAKVGLREVSAAGAQSPKLSELLRGVTEAATTKRREASPEVLQRIVQLATSKGDPARGEKLFRSSALSCLRCHAIAGAGGNVGPDLAAIGTAAQPDFLVEHILQPNKHVKDGYSAYAISTTTGDSLIGVQLRETDETYVLRDATRDEIVVRKETVKRRKPIGTIMPTGLADSLTDGELADLVRFLSELGKTGPYVVTGTTTARRWWTLTSLAGIPKDAEGRGIWLRDTKETAWTREFTNVAGEVPLEEVATGPGKTAAVVRCAIDVRTAGKVGLTLNGAEGLRMWVDGTPREARASMTLDFKSGRHTFDFWVDLPVRPGGTLRCSLVDLPRSQAKAQWSAD